MSKFILGIALNVISMFSYGQRTGKVQFFDSLVVRNGIRVGSSSLHLGSFNSTTVGQQNFIFTTGGPLRINWGIGAGTQSTHINPYWGRIGLGTADPKERVQIGREMTFHDGGTKYFARNSYWTSIGNTRIVSGGAGVLYFGGGGETGLSVAGNGAAGSAIQWKPALRANAAGKLGLWTRYPKERLQIGSELTFHDGGTKYFARNAYFDNGDKRIVDGHAMSIRFTASGRMGFSIAQYGAANTPISWQDALWINNNGRVGVGMQWPLGRLQVNYDGPDFDGQCLVASVTGTDHKAFSVINRTWANVNCPNGQEVFRIRGDGLVEAREICLITTGWCDDVFRADYDLWSLGKVRQFIQKNGHLPAVPSESEVLEKGQDLGEMNKVLLRKVEELYLHAIDREEEVLELKKEVEDLRNELTAVKAQLDESGNVERGGKQ